MTNIEQLKQLFIERYSRKNVVVGRSFALDANGDFEDWDVSVAYMVWLERQPEIDERDKRIAELEEKLKEATKPDTFWDYQNPVLEVSDPKELTYNMSHGEIIDMQCVRSFPDQIGVCEHYDDGMHIVARMLMFTERAEAFAKSEELKGEK